MPGSFSAHFRARWRPFLFVLVEVGACLAEVCAGDGDGGNSGCLGAQDARAESDGLPGVSGEELHLFGGPAALGPDGESYLAGLRRESGLERRGLLQLAKEDAGG